MVVQNGIGLALAMLLSLPGLTGGSVYRTLIFLPTMLSVVIIGFVWQLMLNPLWGIAETILAPWASTATSHRGSVRNSTALITVSLISVWQFVGIPIADLCRAC